MRYIDLEFVAELQGRRAQLPPFLGATLRGVLGYELKRTVCHVAHGACPRCLLRTACAYPAVFEGLAPADRTSLRRYPFVPQPFVLDVAAPAEAVNGNGPLAWGLRLFGPAIRSWPFVVHTFAAAGAQGIGRARLKYTLARVTDGRGGPALWSAAGAEMAEPSVRRVERQPGGRAIGDRLRWRFETPVRLRTGGRLAGRDITGLAIVLAGRRRYGVLESFYGDGGPAPAEPPQNLHLHADQFATVHNALRAWSFSRFSGRQRQRMELAGLLGEIVIEGPWAQAGPWLSAIETIHLGKATSFGFGRVHWEVA